MTAAKNIGRRLGFQEGGQIPIDQDGMLTPATVTAFTYRSNNSEGRQFIDGLNNFRKKAMTDFNLSDDEYADLADTAIAIAKLSQI